MIDHLGFDTTHFEVARDFYDAVLGELGYVRNVNMNLPTTPGQPERRMCAYGPGSRPILWLAEVDTAPTPRHVAFAAPNAAAVVAFHTVGLKLGAKDNGAPGPRPIYHPAYYGAFLIDPDGNNVEAVIHTYDAADGGQ